MSEEDRKAKAAARQAKLLAKSEARLARITGAGKEEGRVANDASVGISAMPPRAQNPAAGAGEASTSATTTSALPPAPTSLSPDDDPAEVDLALSSRAGDEPPRVSTAARAGAAPTSFEEMLMSRMAGQDAAAAGGAAGGAPQDDMFAQMLATLSGGGGAGGGMPGSPFAPPQAGASSPAAPPRTQTRLERLRPALHFVSMAALALYTIFWLEPRYSGREQAKVDWHAWARLGERDVHEAQIGVAQIATVPLLWMFVTVELILQGSRLVLMRNDTPVPGMMSTVLAFVSQVSPVLASTLRTGLTYVDILSACMQDACVLVFLIGAVVFVGRRIVSDGGGDIAALGKHAVGLTGAWADAPGRVHADL